MRLVELAQRYAAVQYLQKASRDLYLRVARTAEAICGADVSCITEESLHILAGRLVATRKSETASDYLRRLRTLLTFAWQLRLIADLPRVWPKIRTAAPLPEAWTSEQVAKLFLVATEQPGHLGPHRAGDWWRAFLNVAWETGLRVSQMFRLRWADVDYQHRCIVIQACPGTKSYRPQIKPLSVECLAALELLAEPPRELIFCWPEWPKSRRDFFSVWRYLCWLAGIPAPRSQRQLTHRWRRSSVTEAARNSLEAARRHAGHTSPETTLRHYIDPRLLLQQPPPVPPLHVLLKANGQGNAKPAAY